MNKLTLYMGLAASVLIIVASYQGGFQMVLQGIKHSGTTFIMIAPLLLLAFGVTGLLQGLLKKETIKRLLGHESGFRGILLGSIAGAIMPGGPYVFYPIMVTFLIGGAEIGSLIAFLAAKNLWTVSRIPMEVALVGWHVFISRYIVTFPFPPVMGFLGNLFFPNASDNIRTWLDQQEKPIEQLRRGQ